MTRLIAQPWWVNLLILVPPVAYFSWRRQRVPLTVRQLISSGVFAAAFGFLEAVVVVYLRAAAGLLPGYQGTRSHIIVLSGEAIPGAGNGHHRLARDRLEKTPSSDSFTCNPMGPGPTSGVGRGRGAP